MSGERPIRFELRRLASYDDHGILEEIRRVAALEPEGPLTVGRFEQHSKVHGSTIRRRFGGWRQALAAAGLAHRYSGRTVSERMREQPARGVSGEAMVSELQRVAALLGTSQLARTAFDAHADAMKASSVERRFGSWNAALRAAGLEAVPLGRRWSEDDYMENLLTVWTYHGRQPFHREMDEPPSRITSGAYEHRWGTWRKALQAFVDRVNADVATEAAAPRLRPPASTPTRPATTREDSRHVPMGIRYEVLRRDDFRCVLCGASPAITRGVTLHVDHVLPLARGGKTRIDNLRTLCQSCNLGKGSKIE